MWQSSSILAFVRSRSRRHRLNRAIVHTSEIVHTSLHLGSRGVYGAEHNAGLQQLQGLAHEACDIRPFRLEAGFYAEHVWQHCVVGSGNNRPLARSMINSSPFLVRSHRSTKAGSLERAIRAAARSQTVQLPWQLHQVTQLNLRLGSHAQQGAWPQRLWRC